MRRPISLAAALLLWAASTLPASAEGIRLEAEDIFIHGTYGEIPEGMPMSPVRCLSSSGGYSLDGLDIEGEWIAWFVGFNDAVCFTDSLRSARTTGAVLDLELMIGTSPYDILEIDTLRTVAGTGVFCREASYDWVSSSRVRCLDPGVYAIMIRMPVTIYPGARTRIDCLDLSFVPTAVERITWGRIRALYR